MDKPVRVDEGRRHFLKVSAASGGAFLIGTHVSGCASRPENTSASGSALTPNAWIKIYRNNRIILLVDRAEMGQGVTTALPMLIAEELEVGLDQVNVEFAPAERRYDNPVFGLQVTGGSTAVIAAWEPLRKAGAAARQMLVKAAAQRWGNIPESRCRAERGSVVDRATGNTLPYGALAAEAALLKIPKKIRLKAPANFDLIGTRQKRMDVPAKVDGSAEFGIDVKVPGMLYATVQRAPTIGGQLSKYDDREARRQSGVRDVIKLDNAVAVVGESYWQVLKARQKLKIEWKSGPHSKQSSEQIRQRYKALAGKNGNDVHNEGHALKVIKRSQHSLSATYELPYLAHATMEPMNATAYVQKDRCDIWVSTQNQGGARDTAAAVSGLDIDQCFVHTTYLGGGFGRRFEVDFVAEAVAVSKEIKSPVKVVWSREDDMQNDFYRPAMRHDLQAVLNEEGAISAWHHKVIGPNISARGFKTMLPQILPNWMPRFLKSGMGSAAGFAASRMADAFAVEGAVEMPYKVDNIKVEYVDDRDGFVPIGFWRSVAHSHTALAVEGFIDELAFKANADPYQFRRRLLRDSPRHLAVLDMAVDKAGWDQPKKNGASRGLALHASFGSYVAQVAEVTVSPGGEIKVNRVVCVVDCGQVVNPAVVEAQMESGIVFGLTAALKGEISIKEGAVVQDNFHTYQMLRIHEMPTVEVHLIDSQEAPGGVGEPGTPPIAPAVANAVFAATGRRVRKMPMTPERVMG